jgi:hypothetical protein
MESHIVQRVSYAETASKGSTVLEEDKDGIASKEIKTLVEEILKKYDR